MEEGMEYMLLVLVIFIFLGVLVGIIYATWKLVRYHSHLSSQEKKKKWFKDFWLAWFDIVLNIFEAF